MRRTWLLLATVCLSARVLSAAAAPLAPELSGLGFLLGSWTGGAGRVAETGGTSKGESSITAGAGGALLLRRDHTQLFDKAGKPAGAFDQVMTIYAEAGAIHADYFDGTHIIHYTSAAIEPGKSVTFATASVPGAPAFRLTYAISGQTLAVAFAMTPPGQGSFRPVATGTLHKSGS